MVQSLKLCFHPFLDASHLQLVYATLYMITVLDLPVQGGHIYQINVGGVLMKIIASQHALSCHEPP